jgi:flagellar basal-body rod protein FlgB
MHIGTRNGRTPGLACSGARLTMAAWSPSFLTFGGNVLGLQEARQRLIASNIANADTPGYKAMDIDFTADLNAAMQSGQADPKPMYIQNSPTGLDNNNVSLTAEKVKAIDSTDQSNAEVTFLHQATTDLITALRPNPNGI